MSSLFVTDGAFWLTCLAVAVAVLQRGRGPGRQLWWLCVVVAALSVVVPVSTVVSFGVSLLALTALHALRPFASAVPLLALPLLSPFARYLNAVVGFEWRLGLSGAAGKVFEVMGRDVTVRGSEVVLHGRAFGVDAGCTGLHMLLSGVAMALLLVAVAEYKKTHVLRIWAVLGVLATAVLLVLLSNLARIVVLIDRGWGAEHALHGATGLVCFLVYVCGPLLLGVWWLSGQAWAQVSVVREPKVALRAWRPVLALSLAVGCFAFAKTRPPAPVFAAGQQAELRGQTPERRAHNVLAYQFPDALVFHKPIGAFYHAEHSPLICWRGSGYQIVAVRQQAAPGGKGQVYVGTLARGKERLYTAWWMSNGARNTIQQSVWRADMATGAAAYALINVTAGTARDLECWVGELYGDDR